MSFNQKPSETGWFYHAPAKPKRNEEPQAVPPPSQIPGLAGDHFSHPEEPQKRIWIKDTDSDYIKLAKQGGRADLLRFRSPKPKANKPVGYPRVDWFYHDDYQAEEPQPAQDENYEFMLPDYMVHQTIQDIRAKKVVRGDGAGGDKRTTKQKRAPFAQDSETRFETVGPQSKNKQVKLPELKQPGYGVRAEKLEGKPVKPIAGGRRAEMCKPPESELSNKTRRAHMPAQDETDPYSMGKILSFGYQKEWEDARNKWEEKQEKVREAFDRTPTQEKMQSEYQAKIQNSATRRDSGKTGSRRESAADMEMRKIQARKQREADERPEMFKLSKFKNVPPKTDTHRHASKPVPAAV